MRVDEFIARVSAEPERVVAQRVWSTPPDVIANAKRPGGMSMRDFLAAPGRREEIRESRYRHILGAPATREGLDEWQLRSPSHPLPADLVSLLTRMNGIHLWSSAETGRSYSGIAPIEEWDLARKRLCGPAADPTVLDDRFIVISYHEEDSSFIVLDTSSGDYYLMDASGPDTSSPIARTAEELLDWLWKTRQAPSS